MKKFLILIILIFGLSCISISFAQQVTHGPVTGAVTESSACFVLSTDIQANVSIQLSTSDSFQNSIISVNSITNADSGYFSKIYVSGLEPDTKYYYRVLVNGTSSDNEAIRFFYTFPRPGTKKIFTFLSGSCEKLNNPGNVFKQMSKEDARFFIQQGDWGYPDTTASFFSMDYNKVIESYQSKYSPSYPMQLLLNKTPVDYTYDDHDMAGNNSDGSGSYSAAIANSIKGYQSFFPHYPLAAQNKGLWHKFTFGNVDVFMLDNRSQRDPNINALKITQDSIYFEPDTNHSILGEQQMNWLLDELAKSTADWKFISSGTPFNPALRSAIELGVQLQKDPRFNSFPTSYGNFGMKDILVELADKWAGFPGDINKLIKYVKEKKIRNIIFLTGDTHTTGIDDGNNSVFPELMAGPLDIKNNGFVYILELFGISVFDKGGHTIAGGLSSLGSAYGRITVFGADSVLLEAVSENGKVLGKNTVMKGFLPASVGGTAVPNSIIFDSVSVPGEKTFPFIITNNSSDTLVVTDVILSDPHFSAKTQLPLKIAPLSKEVINVSYKPAKPGENNVGEITIKSNSENSINKINLSGTASQSSGIGRNKTLNSFELFQNYPNPFNPLTNISFYLPEASNVSLDIFDSFGRKLKTLVQGLQEAGLYNIVWDGTTNSGIKASSGIYYLNFKAGNFSDTKKVIILK